MFAHLFSYFMFASVKYLSSIFYRFDVNWLSESTKVDWNEIKLIVFLNHTSLFEPIFIKVAPNRFIWRLAANLLAPGADITLKRPIAGRFFKWIAPGLVPITRKRDASWYQFMQKITPQSIVTILPEGRMMRKDGLDKHGKSMTARGGLADILQQLSSGKALFVYSGGLHHIQSPGQKLPKIFKRVKVNLELMSIARYKEKFAQHSDSINAYRRSVIDDLNQKLQSKLPNR